MFAKVKDINGFYHVISQTQITDMYIDTTPPTPVNYLITPDATLSLTANSYAAVLNWLNPGNCTGE